MKIAAVTLSVNLPSDVDFDWWVLIDTDEDGSEAQYSSQSPASAMTSPTSLLPEEGTTPGSGEVSPTSTPPVIDPSTTPEDGQASSGNNTSTATTTP